MHRLALLLALIVSPNARTEAADTAPFECSRCTAWNAPQTPFRLFGNSYYIGTRGLSSVLIDTGAGLIVLDGGLPQSAQRIADNIRALGFRVEDIRWILNSHAHFDHAGGIAALARMSGAQVAASARGAEALVEGAVSADDPQAGYAPRNGFPAVQQVTTIVDGGTLTLGNVRIRANYTPGHTAGSTTWSWQSCTQDRCVAMVYADSLNAVSAPGFRFSDFPASLAAFRRSIARVAELPCEVMVPVHPEFSDLFTRAEGGTDALRFVDTNACRHYASAARRQLRKAVANETVATPRASAN